MFEKEAIRHAFEDTIGVECLIKPVEDFTYEELSDEQQEKAYDFKKGAEFGYNKANEWHDLRKNPNDLPKDGELVLANNLLYTESVKFGKDKGLGVSWKTDYFELGGVVLWKEIVLPELKEM